MKNGFLPFSLFRTHGKHRMNHLTLAAGLFLALSMLLPAPARAAHAGWRQITVPAVQPGGASTVVALYYPTQTTARWIPMGPFPQEVAPGAPPLEVLKGLVVLSHGTGGSELGHGRLATALARSGYLVAALRHPGDNWQDRSLLQERPDAYFHERPRQVSRVIDAVLDDPLWKGRIAGDARGPWIGALGHSAGGYTVLALAGGRPDLQRIERHCAANREADPIFCRTGRAVPPTQPAPPTAQALAAPGPNGLHDPRVRAVVALAPVGVVFTAASLASIRVPVAVFEAEADRWLVPRFHTAWIVSHLPGVQFQRVAAAWHFAFMDKPEAPIPTDDGDIGADAPGFDRPVLHTRLARELPAFFDQSFR